jgi:hypothetical protein
MYKVSLTFSPSIFTETVATGCSPFVIFQLTPMRG